MVNAPMTAQPGPKKSKGALTPEAFARFLKLLSEDDEVAYKQYQDIEQRLLQYFERKGCPDPKPLFDETIDVVIRDVDAGEKIANYLRYCYGVAKNKWHEYHRKPQHVPLMTEDIPAPRFDDSRLHELKLECLESCMEKLLPRSRELIARYHESQGRDKIETRKHLAREHGGENTLRIKAFRIRKKLHACVTACVEEDQQII